MQYFDPGHSLYTYETIVGYGFILLSMAGMIWFWYGLWNTSKKYPTKRPFFVILLVMYTVWSVAHYYYYHVACPNAICQTFRFISIPFVAFMAAFLIPKFRREKIVNAVDMVVAFRTHILFMVCHHDDYYYPLLDMSDT